MSTLRHAACVVAAYSILFCWIFATPLLNHEYLFKDDLYDWFLPIFLSRFSTWTHAMFAGLPLFADTSDSQYYVMHVVFSHVLHWWTGYIMSAYVLAASFMYAYVFHVTRSKTAAALAGTAYGLSAAMLQRMPHINFAHASAWFPLFVLSIDRVMETGSRRWMAVGAFAEATIFLSGHPQPILYASYFWLVYVLVGARAQRLPAAFYGRAALMFGLGVALTSVKALPFVEASRFMARQEVTYEWFNDPAQTPVNLLGVLFPRAGDSGLGVPLYAGVGVLLLAMVGVSARRHWRTWVWAGAAIVGLLVVAGDATPVAFLIYKIPGFGLFRISSRMLFVYAAATAALAGFAVAEIQRATIPPRVVAWMSALVLLVSLLAAVIVAHANGPTPLSTRNALFGTSTRAAQFGFIVAAAALALLAARARRKALLLCGLVAVTCADLTYNSSYAVGVRGLRLPTIPVRDTMPSVHTRALAGMIAGTRQRLLPVAGSTRDPVIPGGLARYWDIETAGGFSPIMTNRLATMAGMGSSGDIYPEQLALADRALDVLAVRYLIVSEDDFPAPDVFVRDGITWAAPPLTLTTGRTDCAEPHARRTEFQLPADIPAASIVLVAHMRCAEAVPQNAEVASVDISGPGVNVREPLVAGVNIGDRALSDPERQSGVRHRSPGNVFDDPELRHSHLIRIDLPRAVSGARVVVRTTPFAGWIGIDRVTVIDETGASRPQTIGPLLLADRQRWREVMRFRTSRVTDRDTDETSPSEKQYLVYENVRAMPRAWIVGTTQTADEAAAIDAVRFSQFSDGRPFDPTRMAIVEPGRGGAAANTFPPGRMVL